MAYSIDNICVDDASSDDSTLDGLDVEIFWVSSCHSHYMDP